MVAQPSRRQAKQEAIRSSARRLFLEHGFAETSMDAVTAAAGVSKQTVYRYYPSKAELFADVLRGLIAEPAAAGLDGGGSPPSPRTEAEFAAALVSGSERYLARVLEPEQLALLRVVIAE